MVVDSSLLTSVPWHLMPLSVSGLSCPQSFIQCVFYFFLVSFLSVGFYTICHFSLCFFLIKIFIFLTSLCSSPRLYLMFLSNILHWKKKAWRLGSCEVDRLVYCILRAIHQSQGSCKRGFHCFECFPHFFVFLCLGYFKNITQQFHPMPNPYSRVLMSSKCYFIPDSWSYF